MANECNKDNRDLGGKAPASRSLPSAWVARFIGTVPAGGRVLDVACGSGRHLRLAVDRGLAVTGIDRDLSGVADLEGRPDVTLIAADLEDGRPFPLAGSRFDAVIVANYLWRPVLPDIVGCVASDGILIYETFAIGQERLGKPRNPEFLLRPGELLAVAAPRLIPVAYEHVRLVDPPRSCSGSRRSVPITSG